jgi:hypothetical protein
MQRWLLFTLNVRTLPGCQFRRLVAPFSPRRSVFKPGQLQVRFLLDEVPLERVFLWIRRVPIATVTPLLLHAHLSPPYEVCDSPYQVVNYTLGPVRSIISDPALGWSWSKGSARKEVSCVGYSCCALHYLRRGQMPVHLTLFSPLSALHRSTLRFYYCKKASDTNIYDNVYNFCSTRLKVSETQWLRIVYN